MKKRNGFTLVELLAVIVILAIILVIAVPSIMDTIEDSRKGAIESSVKMIASAAESQKMVAEALGKTFNVTDCKNVDWSGIKDDNNYTACEITWSGDTATVKLTGANKFDKYTCQGTKITVTDTNCKKSSS